MFANVSPEVLPSRKNPTTCKYIRGGGVLYYRVQGCMQEYASLILHEAKVLFPFRVGRSKSFECQTILIFD